MKNHTIKHYQKMIREMAITAILGDNKDLPFPAFPAKTIDDSARIYDAVQKVKSSAEKIYHGCRSNKAVKDADVCAIFDPDAIRQNNDPAVLVNLIDDLCYWGRDYHRSIVNEDVPDEYDELIQYYGADDDDF